VKPPKVNRRTIRRFLTEMEQAECPITGTSTLIVSRAIVRGMYLHPAYSRKVQEIVEAMLKNSDISIKDGVVCLCPDKAQATAAKKKSPSPHMKMRANARRVAKKGRLDMLRQHANEQAMANA